MMLEKIKEMKALGDKQIKTYRNARYLVGHDKIKRMQPERVASFYVV